jgi:hypothetical protein
MNNALAEAAAPPTLAELEAVIERGLATFVEVGTALLRIRDGRLYRAAGFKTFEAYCRERWSMSKPYATQVIDAAKVTGMLKTVAVATEKPTPPPESERVARELVPLAKRDPEAAAETWRAVTERTNGKPTAADVREAVKKKSKPHRERAGVRRTEAHRTFAEMRIAFERWTLRIEQYDLTRDQMLDAARTVAPALRQETLGYLRLFVDVLEAVEREGNDD